jgi:hypothetical protein
VIRQKNFSNWDVNDIPVDTEYEKCNFSQNVPDTSGANPVGIRLFPGDDTPRTFRDCNMLNCEPPPGSTVDNCKTLIMAREQDAHTETITVDSVVVSSRTFKKSILYGKINPQTLVYEYEPVPVDVPEDY